MKNIFSVRGVLGILLGLSVLFAGIATYYKITVWGFSVFPSEKSEVWTIDAHISFKPTKDAIEISLATPSADGGYKILSEDVIASGYEVAKDVDKDRMIIRSQPRKTKQNVYYRIMLYDNKDVLGKLRDAKTPKVSKPLFENEQQEGLVEEIWNLADKEEGKPAARIIKTLNADILPPEVDAFLPFIDNWATCDQLSPKAFKKEPEKLLPYIQIWIKSDKTYTIRFAIGLLMQHFLDDHFDLKYADEVAGIRSEEYYVRMMIAWYFATALAKQYELVLPYLEDKRLDDWVHNKAIRKSIESYRITDEQKAYLRTLKVRQSKQH